MEQEVLKTGTTTIGIVCSDGIVLAADRRATAGNFIVNKNIQKVHELVENMVLTMAGSVSDVQLLIKVIRAEINLKKIRTGREISMKEASNMLASLVYSNIRRYSLIPGVSHFILGGKDKEGFHLYDIYADGSVTEVTDYVSSGSGSVMAYGVLETLFVPNMSITEAAKLVIKGLNAAIQRDSASGNGYDIFAITKDGVKKIAGKDVTVKVE